jgi:hypothetical protein
MNMRTQIVRCGCGCDDNWFVIDVQSGSVLAREIGSEEDAILIAMQLDVELCHQW